MSLDPEPDPTTEPQDALDPQTGESGSEAELGDAGKSKGPDFVAPILTL